MQKIPLSLLLVITIITCSCAQPIVPRIGQCQLQAMALNERNLLVSNNFVYMTGNLSGLTIINIVRPDSPFVNNTIGGMGNNTRGIGMYLHYVLVTNPDSGLFIIDNLHIDSLQHVSYLPLLGACRLTIEGDNAYIATRSTDSLINGLVIVNIANPSNPTISGFCRTRAPTGVYIQNGYAFLAAVPGIVVVDVHNTLNPIVIGSATCPYSDGITLQENYAYVANDSGLCIFDVSNPSNPTRTGFYYMNAATWTTDVAIQNHIAFLSLFGLGFRVIDIGNPSSPVLAGITSMTAQSNRIHSVFVNDHYLYTAEYNYLGIFDFSNLLSVREQNSHIRASHSLLSNPFPNPFNTSTLIKFELPQTSHVKVQVYDNLGRFVNTLADENLTSGEHHLRWNGIRFPSGTYFVRMSVPGFAETKRITLVK